MPGPHPKSRAAAFVAGVGLLLVTPGVAVADAGYATPPPLPPGTPVPVDKGKPDLDYRLRTACVQSFGADVQLGYRPWAQDRLRITEAHKLATGKGVTVAVIDTGVHRHEYLAGRLIPGGDYVRTDEGGGTEDCDGHGTEVAGIIAAKTPEGTGFEGVAPDAKILTIRQSSANYTGTPRSAGVTARSGTQTAGNVLTLAMAIRRAADKGAKVINMSVDNCRAAGPITPAERTLQATLHYAVDVKDVVLVSSAGNLNQNDCPGQNNGADPTRPSTIVTPPWFADDVVSVAAVDRAGHPADFSVHGPWVTVAAPGTEIVSLDPASDALANQTVINQRISPIQGTSFAAPYVSGLAALIRQKYPDLTARQVMHRIARTATHPATPSGRNTTVGYGTIDPVAALTADLPEERGAPAAKPVAVTGDLPPDTSPMWIVLLGAGGGIGLLLGTTFVVHTVRRNRRDRPVAAHRT